MIVSDSLYIEELRFFYLIASEDDNLSLIRYYRLRMPSSFLRERRFLKF